MKYLLLAVALVAGCAVTGYPDTGRQNLTDYSFHPTYTTGLGVLVDDPAHQLDQDRLDKIVENVEACLQQFKEAPLTTSETTKNWCFGTPVLTIKYGLKVKVPPDWHVSACTGNEIFPCHASDASCEAKQETPTAQCPCSCRAIIQDNEMIVTAPNLQLFPGQLVQLLTGCYQIWTGGRLQACGMPQ